MKIIVAWYIAAFLIEYADISNVSAYYLAYSVLSVCTIWACVESRQLLINGYGVINFVALCCYFLLIIDDVTFIHTFMWDSVLPFSTVVILYETVIIIKGAADVCGLRGNRASTTDSRNIFHLKNPCKSEEFL